MQSDFLQLAIAFAGYVCIGFCVYMISRKMLVDIDRKEPRQPGGCKLKTAPVRPVVAARPAEYVCSEDLFY
ncbi:hypothetical protein [Escherichia coli]|uniref:hypothetical protein n=1 Tax=Escherichia coli TaxID=562 RepID=UPI00388F61A9